MSNGQCGEFDGAYFKDRIIRVECAYIYLLKLTSVAEDLWGYRGGEKELFLLKADERKLFANRLFEVVDQQTYTVDKSYHYCLEVYKHGRLIIMFPYASVSDLTAKIESDGFFDLDEYPPPSTWIHYSERGAFHQIDSPHIIAWVPPKFVINAQQGMEFSPVPSMDFLVDSEEGICYRNIFEEMGLLV